LPLTTKSASRIHTGPPCGDELPPLSGKPGWPRHGIEQQRRGIVPHRRAGATETKSTPPTTLAEALPSLERLGVTPELVEAALKICEVELHTAELMPQVAAAASEGC